MKHKIFQPLVIGLLVINLGLIVWFKTATPKIAFVRSVVVVEKFKGMDEARTVYQGKLQQWQSEITAMEKGLQETVDSYEAEFAALSEKERELNVTIIKQQQKNIETYVSSVQEKANAEDELLTQGALNQINSYIEEYADENGFDIVFGTTGSGSILHGVDAMDLTEEILEGLNENYR